MDNRSYVVTNSIKTLKMVHMKENLKKKKKKKTLLALKMEEEVMSQEMQEVSRNWKRQESRFSPELL